MWPAQAFENAVSRLHRFETICSRVLLCFCSTVHQFLTLPSVYCCVEQIYLFQLKHLPSAIPWAKPCWNDIERMTFPDVWTMLIFGCKVKGELIFMFYILANFSWQFCCYPRCTLEEMPGFQSWNLMEGCEEEIWTVCSAIITENVRFLDNQMGEFAELSLSSS